MDGVKLIYRRAEGGNVFVSRRNPSAKRHLKKSLKSASPETAGEKAMSFALDKLATDRHESELHIGAQANNLTIMLNRNQSLQ